MKDISKFKEARLEAFEKWKFIIRLPVHQISSQLIIGENENSIECEWQKRARNNGYNHINLFCSLSLWADNITDLLTDERYDNLEFQNWFGSGRTVSRYYFRFLLTISEYFVDFCDIYQKIVGKKVSDKIVRKEMSLDENKFQLDKFFHFSNTLIKHKTPAFHKYNHHLIYLYDDYLYSKSNYLEYQNIKEEEIVSINCSKISKDTRYLQFPRLVELIRMLEFSYLKLASLLENDIVFKKICTEFESVRK